MIGNPRELKAITKAGKTIVVDLNISEYIEDNEVNYVAVIRDVTEKKELQEKIIRHAMYDKLTDLRTLEALNYDFEVIDHTEKHGGYVAAVMIDIDEFQQINSVYGYDAGDYLLKQIAMSLKEIAFNHNSEAYRPYGDRFIIASAHNSKELAVSIKDKYISRLVSFKNQIKDKLNIPVSITAVCMAKAIEELEGNSIMKYLEMSLMSARRQGFSGIISNSAEDGLSYALQKNALSMKLKSGLNLDALDIAIQPKVNSNQQIVSCEALLRWRDPEFGLLYLGDFISVAESTGAIIEVGEYVLKRTCQFLSELKSEQRVRTFVNLSIRQLADKYLVEKIIARCKEYELPHTLLGFELTESMIAEDVNLLKSTLFKLESLGFEIAIDDFGTGQSNLKYIQQLPAAVIKIDKSFIDDINGEADNYPIIDSVIAMAGFMHRKTVAEGVESAIQAEYLWSKGVDEIQGYFYHKPMPVKEVLKLLSHEKVDVHL